MALASTVLAQSAVAEGGELFPALLAHLRRLCTKLHGSMVATYWESDIRELKIGEGGEFSCGTSVHSDINLGAYECGFTNLRLAGMNKPIPNLTTVYLDAPLVGPTPEPLECASLPGHLENPSGYPPISKGGGPATGGFKMCPPPPPYSTHPRMHPHTGWAQPGRVMQPSMGPDKNFYN